MRSASRDKESESVLQRTFRILHAFSGEKPQLRLTELTSQTGLPKATVHRLANQLVELGILERRGEAYCLGLRLFALGSAVARQRRLIDAAVPFMEDLYEATHQVIQLGVMDGSTVLYLQRLAGCRSPRVPTRVGEHQPIHCTALGKAMLAYGEPSLVESVIGEGLRPYTGATIVVPRLFREHLATIREKGVAYDREEFAIGLTCIAAPVIGNEGRAVAAISISGPTTDRFDPCLYASAVRTAAHGIARSLPTA